MDEEKGNIVIEEEAVEERKSDTLATEIFGYLFVVLVVLTVAFGVSNCSLRNDLEDVKEAQEISLEEVSDGNWYDNCYVWSKDGGFDFACYEKDVWDAPCMMSFRLLENTPDEHGDISTFMLEVREVCPSN